MALQVEPCSITPAPFPVAPGDGPIAVTVATPWLVGETPATAAIPLAPGLTSALAGCGPAIRNSERAARGRLAVLAIGPLL